MDMTKLRVVIRKFANMHENNGDDRDHRCILPALRSSSEGEKLHYQS